MLSGAGCSHNQPYQLTTTVGEKALDYYAEMSAVSSFLSLKREEWRMIEMSDVVPMSYVFYSLQPEQSGHC